VAVLAAGGLIELWDRARRSTGWSAALAAVAIATAVWASVLLAQAGGFVPWLAPAAIVLAALAGGALLLARVESPRQPHSPIARRLLPVAAGAGGPGASVGTATIKYLEAHQGAAKYMVAAVGSNTAGTIALQSARNVIDMGGFMGANPAPTLAQVKRLIDTGQLHYILLGGVGGGPGSTSGNVPAGVGGASASVLPGGGGPDGTSAAIEVRDKWIESHGTVVTVPGEGASGSGATLYYFAR
jgi:hypothetical protein